ISDQPVSVAVGGRVVDSRGRKTAVYQFAVAYPGSLTKYLFTPKDNEIETVPQTIGRVRQDYMYTI
ncbi:hypothetical protein KIPB_016785, partial [Kipferlia bialata]